MICYNTREKAAQVAERLKEMKLSAAAKKVQDGIEETLTYMDFPTQHWTRIRTNNTIERLNREIKRRTKAIGAFPDGQSALSVYQCAKESHIPYTTLSDIVKGKNRIEKCTAETIYKLARTLHVTMEELLTVSGKLLSSGYGRLLKQGK